MDRKTLRNRLDASLARAEEELRRLPFEYSEEAWRRQKEIGERIRALVEMKALFATPEDPREQDGFWREILY